MHAIGMNEIHMIAGALNATAAVTRPSEAARLYAGAVEATPTTVAEARPRAPAFRPLLSTAPPRPPGRPAPPGSVTTVAMQPPRQRPDTCPVTPETGATFAGFAADRKGIHVDSSSSRRI